MTKTVRLIIGLLLALTFALVIYYQPGSQNPDQLPEQLTVGQFSMAKANPSVMIIDLRTSEELEETGRIKGATHIDFYDKDFLNKIRKLDPNQQYLLYCRSGNRSNQILKRMKELGFTDVHELDGGIRAWLDARQSTVE